MRHETGDVPGYVREETWDRILGTRELRQETCDRRCETRDVGQETGELGTGSLKSYVEKFCF